MTDVAGYNHFCRLVQASTITSLSPGNLNRRLPRRLSSTRTSCIFMTYLAGSGEFLNASCKKPRLNILPKLHASHVRYISKEPRHTLNPSPMKVNQTMLTEERALRLNIPRQNNSTNPKRMCQFNLCLIYAF